MQFYAALKLFIFLEATRCYRNIIYFIFNQHRCPETTKEHQVAVHTEPTMIKKAWMTR